jgi:uncharacterized Fe-S cluster-containing radical SAM superfamily protein
LTEPKYLRQSNDRYVGGIRADAVDCQASFKERYNLHWCPKKMGFMSPVEVRQAYAMRKAA